MGFTWEGDRTLVDLIDEMSAELRQQMREQGTAAESPVDWSDLRDVRVQAALLKLISALGQPPRAEIQAELAHLPELASRVPRFLQWSSRQGWVKATRPDEQGYRYAVTEAGIAMTGYAASLPPGSSRLMP